METSSELMMDDNKQAISNDESWTDVNLNEDTDIATDQLRGLPPHAIRDQEGNIHEGKIDQLTGGLFELLEGNIRRRYQ